MKQYHLSDSVEYCCTHNCYVKLSAFYKHSWELGDISPLSLLLRKFHRDKATNKSLYGLLRLL